MFMSLNMVNLSAKCGFYFQEQLDIIWDQWWQIKQFIFHTNHDMDIPNNIYATGLKLNTELLLKE